jgi:hypothetical protein
MLDLVHVLNMLQLGILKENAGDERAHDGDIDIFIYGRRDHKATVLSIVGW